MPDIFAQSGKTFRTPASTGAGFVVGSTQWNNTIGSSETLLKGGNVTLKNGVDLVARIVNKVTPNTTLTKAAYQAVRVSGAQGGRLAVALAQANNDNNSADTIGLVTETIATNQEGFILTVGQIENIDTTGSLQGETWTDGDVLYLSPTVAGKLTNIKPTGATGHIVVIGYVEYAHANNGKIYVKVMNGWELDELHNVSISSVANNDLLQYDSVTSLWKNESLSTAGIQPTLVSATNIKTINGTSLLGSGDITVGGGITVGTTAVTSGTIGRIFFEGTGNVVQQSASLFWDNTNARLGIGATPSTTVRLDVRAQGALSTDIAFRVRNSADTANILTVNGDGSQAWLDPANNAFTTIRSGASTLIQWGNTNFLSIGIGHGHTMTGTDSYNVLIGGGATISSGTGEAIKIGVFGVSTGVGTINIGYSGRVNGSYAIKIGRHTGVSSFGGTNSIHLGRTVSGNDIAADNVFMTYFNSQSSSTLTRANGSFGLLGQQAYILGNGTGIYGTDTFMGNGGNTLVIRNHPNIPSTNITDSFQQYSSDIVAGNAAPHFRTENGNIIKLYQQSSSGITTVAQLVTVLQNLGLLS